jgi:hypothetical protein
MHVYRLNIRGKTALGKPGFHFNASMVVLTRKTKGWLEDGSLTWT